VDLFMAVSLDQFIKLLAESGLVSGGDLTAFVDSLPEPPTDAESFAKQLVTAKKLTPFQAQQVWKGKAKHLVLGNYVISEKIGQGGMGMVFRASHKLMKREVALKVLSSAVIKDDNAVKRFLREVQAAAKLTHPHIVAAHDADQSNGTYYLIMEYVEGRDLSVIVKKQGPAKVEQAIDCILQAARGLEYAHSQGVIHRDIKPANLLLDKSGTVKVLDMGLARIENDSADGVTQAGLTGTGTMMGTIDYMSPEQADDSKRAGPQADVYSLGATLYYLLTAKPIIEGDTLGKKLRVLLTGVGLPDSIRSLRSSVPAELDAVFRKMTAFDMKDRYRSMTEVIAALEALQAGDAPGSTSAAGIQPLAAGRSDDSAMQSFVNHLDDGTAVADRTVTLMPEISAPPETMASSVGEATQPAINGTTAFTTALKKPQNRKLVIGGSVAVVLAIGAIVCHG
jgi:hypothetical protein